MSNRRPFTEADDQFLLLAHADEADWQSLAKIMKRSPASIRGRLRNLREEREQIHNQEDAHD